MSRVLFLLKISIKSKKTVQLFVVGKNSGRVQFYPHVVRAGLRPDEKQVRSFFQLILVEKNFLSIFTFFAQWCSLNLRDHWDAAHVRDISDLTMAQRTLCSCTIDLEMAANQSNVPPPTKGIAPSSGAMGQCPVKLCDRARSILSQLKAKELAKLHATPKETFVFVWANWINPIPLFWALTFPVYLISNFRLHSMFACWSAIWSVLFRSR